MVKKLLFNKMCLNKLWLLSLFLPVLGTAQALSGSYIIGASQPAPFNTITNAIARINTSGVVGPVTFLLDDATYAASETFPIVVNAFTGASAVNTLTIKPNVGKTVVVRSNSGSPTSIFDLNGADYVTFDGNNGSVNKALTVYNNSTTHTSAKTVFWLRNTATFNQFKNLNIQQNFSANSDLSLGLFAGGASISTSSNANNPNTTIDNVNFVDVKHLLFVNGTDATGNANWMVNNNTNSSTNSANKPFTGLLLTNSSNFTIANNVLSNFSETNFSYGNFPFAGAIAVTANNGSVSNNQINDVISTIAKTAFGIYLSGNDITVANNVVSNVASTGGGGTDTQNGFGIIVASGNNAKIYYNSVRLGVNQTSGISASIYVDNSCNSLDIRNNIFVNAQTSGSTRVAFYSEGQDTTKYLNLDYNNYQSTQHIGSWGDYYTTSNLKTTLANWRTATAKETNAQNTTPDFVSTTTLRLQQTSNNATLQGVTIAAVVTDIDGENRIKPYMGADELPCTVTTTSFGTAQTICYNREVLSPPNVSNVGGVTYTAVPFNRYVTLNVIQGLQYRIATTASDIGLVKKITLYNNAVPATALSSISASSTTSIASLDWTASFTGVLRIEFTATNCQTNANTDTLSATFIGGSNTVDNATAAGTDSWIGHVYDFTNNPDIVPMPPSDANAFANYLGNFTQTNTVSGSTISLVPNYGGDNNCYSFTAGGTAHSFRTDTFAIRYRMNTTAATYPAGCYFVNITGDDGVRLYIDGTLVLNSWRQQSSTPYNNVLVYLNGSSQLVFDYYEKNGANVSNFNIRPASTSMTSLNTIVTSGPINRCVGTTTLLDGSVVATKGNNTIDPVKYQWQSSTDNSNWTNISGATAEDYTVPATNPSTSTVIYYRRNVFGSTASSAACVYSTASIAITTNPSVSAPIVGTITNVTCSFATGSVVLSGLPAGSWTINQIGAASTTYSGSGSTYTVTGLAIGDYTFTVSRGGCTSASTPNVPITDASSTTWNGTAWVGGITPDATRNAIINGPFTISSNLTACSLTINTGVVVTVASGVTLTITNAVTTNGQLIFENNASLVQTTNATNIGAIEYRRISSPMKNFDYTYWSSPVWGDGTIVPKQTAKNLSPNTLADKYFRFNGNVAVNDWVFDDGEMTPGVGVIIRVPKPGTTYPNGENWNTPTYSQPVAFKGIPNNGDYTFTAGANQLNLIGNPYPSAIDADEFIRDNSGIINGALFFWTHNTAITNNEYTADDYASYTLTGSTGTGVGNFVDTNNNGIMDPGEEVVSNIPLGKIAAGQSFFVESLPTPLATQFVFNNSMRVAGNNTQFFKQANTKKTGTVEKNRVWLNLTNSKGAFKQLLVGYITGATNDWDNLYDGPTFDGQEFVDFYSVNQGKNLTIQGRALPFVDTDVVPLGYRSTIAGPFDISIDNRDGALAGQEIWLEDKKTNTLHELTKGKYTFTAINGVENDRFVLKYINKTLGADDNEVADKSLIVSVKNKKITLTSSAEAITQVQVFDLLGRKLYDKSKINAQEWSISNLSSSEQTLIVKTTLANGAISNKKIIY